MKKHLRFLLPALLLISFFYIAPPNASAKDRGYEAIVNHIKTRYKARRRSIPFLGLAKLAVKIVRPAGVKSINLTIFENLDFSGGPASAEELTRVMRDALDNEWQPLVRIRSRDGEQTCVYAREAGKDIKLMVVAIQRDEAVIARVKVSPTSLRKWMENPKIMGFSLK